MISAFESMVRRHPQRTCFTCVDEAGEARAYSYRETRMLSAALARRLQHRGVSPGDSVSVDLPNCAAYVFLVLAAAYGGFSLVVLNNRLTAGEKLGRLMEIERKPGVNVALRIDEDSAERLMDEAVSLLTGEVGTEGSSRGLRAGSRSAPTRPRRISFTARESALVAEPRSARGLGRASTGRASLRRRDEMTRQDAVEGVIHFAEHAAHVFDRGVRALVMFTSGTTGRSKAVSLTWENVCSAAEASNAALNRRGEGLWQAALPLCHIGGFQVVVRSLLNGTPFILYRRFDAARVLSDASRRGATHISVVDKMLQDMLAACAELSMDVMRRYSCILLGGGAVNPRTLERALAVGARVYASYGMTETSSQIANCLVTNAFRGGLRLMPSYRAHIVDPGEDGFGRLAVKGPGLFEGYLNARAAYTVDGFFLTGDTAMIRDGLLYVKERTDDMFVSGGENVYPAEIKGQILRVPGVADAHVFGVPDSVWGRRPVALVERDPAYALSAPAPLASSSRSAVTANRASAQAPAPSAADSAVSARMADRQLTIAVRDYLGPRLSKLYRPKHLCVLDEFPRTGIGKVDRAALERLYDQRIEVERVVLHRLRLPFSMPFHTPKGTLTQRESVIVEVVDHAGRTGLGECVAFSTDWYLPETIEQDVRVLRDVLAPMVLAETFLHPREASAAFASDPRVAAFPMACGALEPALWDLYGKIVGKPLWQLVGGEAQGGIAEGGVSVPAGAVVGLGSPSETLAAVRRCVEAGYRRVKLKVVPGSSVACVRAVRAAFPQLVVTLDANQSFTERDMDELRALDACGAAWIEEPLDPRHAPQGVSGDLFSRLAKLQGALRTPVCLDESIVRARDLARALAHPELRCYAVKAAKFGGVQPTLDFLAVARERGIDVWMGGMYDTGVSKRLHAALGTLPQVKAPGDIGSTARYFSQDVTDPPYTAERGFVTLNRMGHEHGLGCDLNRAVLARVLVDRIVIER
ncbi:o-succinylbenzoate synthase [Gordonibacter sp. An230]|uniref:o-succinylbenzoate synthase n=1 Tax=Gordonibacter sp. An230 TaxID=1965592 RepID=UPI000B36ED5B|nr:o-succinylbenzoate synthase [Gordonibacter sp. An230]OUO89535.1 o-succinylbenzoate synthase [Gordonibacter sp. An230]